MRVLEKRLKKEEDYCVNHNRLIGFKTEDYNIQFKRSRSPETQCQSQDMLVRSSRVKVTFSTEHFL